MFQFRLEWKLSTGFTHELFITETFGHNLVFTLVLMIEKIADKQGNKIRRRCCTMFCEEFVLDDICLDSLSKRAFEGLQNFPVPLASPSIWEKYHQVSWASSTIEERAKLGMIQEVDSRLFTLADIFQMGSCSKSGSSLGSKGSNQLIVQNTSRYSKHGKADILCFWSSSGG